MNYSVTSIFEQVPSSFSLKPAHTVSATTSAVLQVANWGDGDTLMTRERKMEKENRRASSVLSDAKPGRIDATTKVNVVLQRHPLTGEVFIQYGPLGVAEAGKLYLKYPDETVGEYAARNVVDLTSLLHLLNTAAEVTDLGAKGLRPPPTARGRPPDGPIGYTSAYRDRKITTSRPNLS
jgi:hypothetical protein